MKLGELYKELPTWAKGTVVVGTLAGATVLVLFTVKKLRQLAEERKLNSEGNSADDDLNESNTKPTLSKAALEGMCQTLTAAFDGCGTDEDAIRRVFTRCRNKEDVLALIKTYGNRKFDACNWSGDFGNSSGSLSNALTQELDNDDLETYVNKPLRDARIDYSF